MNAELPGPVAFASATAYVRPEDVASSIPCGSDVQEFVDAVGSFVEAGFTHIALVQIGGEAQEPFLTWSKETLLPELDKAFGG